MNYKTLYLLLAVTGGIVPYIFFIQFMQGNGLDLQAFVEALFVNGAAGGFSADLIIASVAFWVGMFELHRRDIGPAPWLYIVLNVIIGLSFALPFYLFVRHLLRSSSAT